ncbi:MAG: Spy/CpxP family protein refolding chaperone [Acidobacteriaceae bacterium]|nr:Spy/CpxP family protein refolding chaperone [Acidobacteriaceae bacterium]
MKWKYLAIGVAVGLAIAVGATVARAGAMHGHYGHRHMMRWLTHELNLSDAQQAQIKSMIDAEKTTVRPLVQQLATQQKQMLAATANGAYDDAKVRSIANDQSQVIAQLLVEKEKLISNVYQNVLTPEQRTKADALRQRMADRIGKHLQEQTTESKPSQ